MLMRSILALGLSTVAAGILFPASRSARGASYSWQVQLGDWSVQSNWGGVVPTANDTAFIVNGGTATVTSAGAVFGTLSLGGSGGGAVQLTGGSLSGGDQYIGSLGVGSFTQSGGTNAVGSHSSYHICAIGNNAGDYGTYNLQGGLLNVNTEDVGYAGNGVFTQSGGTNSVYLGFTIGAAAGGSGSYTLSGGSLSAGEEGVFTGSFAQTGGTNLVPATSSLNVGCHVADNAAYTLSGSGQLATGSENVGTSGTGSFTQSGGTNTAVDLSVGEYQLGKASFTLSGSSALLSAGQELLSVGSSSTATFTQSGGMNAANFLSIGAGTRYQLGGGTLQLNGGLCVQGTLDGQGSASPIIVASGSLVNLTTASIVNARSLSLSVGPGSLVILGPGMNPATTFGSFSNYGMTLTGGTTLVIGPGQGFSGWGPINDPINCQGTISAQPGGGISLAGSLSLTGTCVVSLGSGNVTTQDFTSQISGGLLSSNYHYVGYTSPGVFTQCGGSNSVSADLVVGYSASGSYLLSGTALLSVAGVEYVGQSGQGTFTQSGGTNAMTGPNFLALGFQAGATGSYTLSGSALLSGNGSEYVGFSGSGAFTQLGGTNNIRSSPLYLGYNAGSRGTYSLSGNGQLTCGGEWIAYNGTGSLSQTGGTNTIVGTLTLGFASSSSATFSLGGNGQLSAWLEQVGYNNGTGVFTQSGGTNAIPTTSGDLSLGGYGGGGTYNLNGGMLVIPTIQSSGTAVFNFNGGTLCVNSSFFSTRLPMTLGTSGGGATFDTNGFAATLSGSLSGAGSLTKVDSGTLILSAGNNYQGTTTISGGILSLANSAALAGGGNITFAGGTLQYSTSNSGDYSGRIVGSTGPISIDTNGVNVTFASSLASSNSGGLTKLGSGMLTLAATEAFTGNTLVTGGTLALGSPLALQSSTLDTSGSGTLSFGTLTAATFGGLTGPGTLALLDASSAAVALSVGMNNATTICAGKLTGPGSLTKIGSGMLALTGSNTYAGRTAISQGELVVNGSLASAVTVNSGGTLGGTGNLTSGTVNSGGQIAPGSPLGTLSFGGNLVLEAGAALDYELDAPGSGDELQVSGLLTLGGALNVSFSSGFAPSTGQTFDLISGPTTGSFAQVNLPVLGNGMSWNTSNLYASGTIAVVPEPSTLGLLGVGATGLLLCARRWRFASVMPTSPVESERLTTRATLP